jgi:hypothetical protein
VIGDKRVYFVRDILEPVDDLFEMIIDFRPDDEVHWATLRLGLPAFQEQGLTPIIVKLICTFLHLHDLFREHSELVGISAN